MQDTVSVAVSVLKIVLLVMLCSCPVFADTSKQNITSIDLLHRKCQIEIKNAADSVRKADCINNETLIKSHDMYDKSFNDIKDAFSCFVNKVAAIILVLSIVISILSVVNFKSASSSKEELYKLKNEFETKTKEFETKTKEFENTMMKSKSYMNILFREMVGKYYEIAADFFSKGDFSNYFINLEVVYIILAKIDLENQDLSTLIFSLNLVLNYKTKNIKPENIQNFVNAPLKALSDFIKYCEKTEKAEHLKIAKQTEEHIRSFFENYRNTV